MICGCGRPAIDPAEVAYVFERHSASPCDLAKLKASLAASGDAALKAFDPYALFFPPGWTPDREGDYDEKAGAGITAWRDGESAVVVAVFSGSPAQKAGIRPGDRLFYVDGVPVSELSDKELHASLYSAPGNFTVKGRKAVGGVLQAALSREMGGMPVVWGFTIPGTKAGYMRAASFMTRSAGRFKMAMNDLLDSGAKRVIIDLRGNRGGSLGELADALGYFAPGPALLYSAVSRHSGYSKVFRSEGAGSYAGIKVVLLTDPDTVSRAEIFAQTLREWGAAVIVGGKTAGNVAATRGFRLKSGGALRLTVARLRPPSGADLDGLGVEPDVRVAEATGSSTGGFTEYPPGLASYDPVIRAALALP